MGNLLYLNDSDIEVLLEYVPEIFKEPFNDTLYKKIRNSISGEDFWTNQHIKYLKRDVWNKVRNEIRVLPCWYADEDNHGFDFFTDEYGNASEIGARIEVMKILNNNPYSDDYVDPERVKRRVTKVRRRMIEEGKDPDND